MNSNIISLRAYIDNKDNLDDSVKVQTFCRLMKMVSDAIEKEERNLIKINLDDININIQTGEIVLPENLFATEDMLEKTIAGYNTGISLMADRKSTVEHKRVAFALMVLGWYFNQNKEAVNSDITVLENFDLYMSKVPNWLQGYFVKIFRKMDYTTSFGDYYQNHFTNKIQNDIKEAFEPYNLTEEQIKRITILVAKETNRLVREGEINE